MGHIARFLGCKALRRVEEGILTDPRLLAFYFSMDGVCLFRKGRRYTQFTRLF